MMRPLLMRYHFCQTVFQHNSNLIGLNVKANAQTYFQKNSNLLLPVTAVCLFGIAVAVHIVLGLFPRKIGIMPDEFYYIGLMRGLASGNGLTIYGALTDFQKVLYPVALLPAMFFSSTESQIVAVGVINSICICSSIFPAYLIGRMLFDNPKDIIVGMILTLVLPDLMYSLSFMAENLFIPLALWVIYIVWKCYESSGRQELVLAFISGLLCYLLYLCKEVALVYCISFLIIYIIAILRKTKDSKQARLSIGLFALGFLIVFAIMKYTLFSHSIGSYAGVFTDGLVKPYSVAFFLYAFSINSIYIIVGFGVFPILMTIFSYFELPKMARDLALFCLLSLLLCIIVITFSISIREDLGKIAFRQHLRYLIPLFIPLLFLFIKEIHHINLSEILKTPVRVGVFSGVIVGFCVLIASFFGIANRHAGIDSNQLLLLQWISDIGNPDILNFATVALPPDAAVALENDGTLLEIDYLDWFCRFLVIAYTAIGFFFLSRKSNSVRLMCGTIVCFVIAAFMIINSCLGYVFQREIHEVEQKQVNEALSINTQLEQIDNSNEVIVVIDDDKISYSSELAYTYIDNETKNYNFVRKSRFELLVRGELNSKYLDVPSLGEGDYILIGNDIGIRIISDNAEYIDTGYGNESVYALYRLTNDSALELEIDGV